ncbi:MAG: cell division protein ZapE [Flexistipes sinusarabici]|uniref:Cell division protein ZapE n=1 Tax=Flexistipes sinusarabici TaxID=2352 RepID=A0A5D0MP73_FLESI|nr:cell division protein ZapE [Flexistipes sinusarabici]TYB33805.1 MAG: cell division protein ZapE [Flexistipes sinusarabici]
MIVNISDLNFDVSVSECMKNMKPHPKFQHCTFENYIPDSRYPSQSSIKNILSEKVLLAGKNKIKYKINNKGFFGFLKRSNSSNKNTDNPDKNLNLYLDGGFGVGKTHLLSACYNVAETDKKTFLSFGELTYFFNFLGIEKSIKYFSGFDLILLDEFELDDPATTRMIAKFFQELGNETLVITTSNTLPSDLGKGQHFQVEEFEREMGVIADSFSTYIIEGEDYRRKSGSQLWKRVVDKEFFMDQYTKADTEAASKGLIGFKDLIRLLKQNHPFKYYIIPDCTEALFIDGIKPFDSLDEALRFAHLVDNCYYYNTKIFIRSEYHLKDLYNGEMLESCFQKKFLRCLSRLDELAVFYLK